MSKLEKMEDGDLEEVRCALIAGDVTVPEIQFALANVLSHVQALEQEIRILRAQRPVPLYSPWPWPRPRRWNW
jgi:hypothetical protein